MKKAFLIAGIIFWVAYQTLAQIPSYVPTNGLVAWYPFNGDYKDYSTNAYNGSVNGSVPFVADRNGAANSAVQLGAGFVRANSNVFQFQYTSSFSLSIWFTKESTVDGGRLISTECNEGNFRIAAYTTTGNYAVQYGTYLIDLAPLNTWTHLVCTYNNGDFKTYQNGILKNSAIIPTSSIQNFCAPFTIGAKAAPAYDKWIGKADDIAVYNRALTPQEISSLYTATAPCQPTSSNDSLSIPSSQMPYTWNGLIFTAAGTQTDTLTNAAGCDSLATLNLTITYDIPSYLPTNSLVGYWPFNGNANDESGNGNNGTVNGATLTSDRFGNVGKAYGFDGVEDRVEVADKPMFSFLLNGDYAINLWFKASSQPSSLQTLVGQGDGDGQYQNRFWRIYLDPNQLTSHIRGNLSDPNDTKNNYTLSSYNVWQMATLVRSYNNNLSLFIDGVLVDIDTDITGLGNPFSQSRNIFFGSFFDSYANQLMQFFNGSLDDIAIYNRVLTPQEISALYTSSAPCQSTSSNDSLSIPSSQLPYTWNGLTFTAAGTQTDTLTNAAGCDSLATLNLTITYDIPSYLPTNGLVGYWPFNGNANDESGNGNNGVVNGATLTTDRFGNVGKAYGFDGNNDNIQIAFSPMLNPQMPFTVSLYGYTKTPTSNQTWVSTNPAGVQEGWDLMPFQNAGMNYEVSINNQWNSFISNYVYPETTWVQSIYVFENNSIKAYINGTLIETSQVPTGNITYGSGKPLFFGSTVTGLNWLNGSLDDIAIYNRALTPQEISSLYQAQSSNTTDTGITLPHDTLRVGINVTNPQRNLHVKDVMRLEPRQAPPTNPFKGDMYFDDRLNKLRVFDGTSWQNCW